MIDDMIDVEDRYAELAIALGFDDVSNPFDYHFDIVARAKELASFVRVV